MEKDNYRFAVGCAVIKNDEILLVRHTYGPANGKLLIPGGFCKEGEMPEEAAARECMEETSVSACVKRLLAVRFKTDTWYPVFLMDYISGTPTSDGNENSEAVFMNKDEALENPQVTDLTKYIIFMIKQRPDGGLSFFSDYSQKKGGGFSLYGIEE